MDKKQQLQLAKLQKKQYDTLQDCILLDQEIAIMQEDVAEKRKEYDAIVKEINIFISSH